MAQRRLAEQIQRISSFLARPTAAPALLRWCGAVFLFGTALAARLAFGFLHGANPALLFYPAILIASVMCGWPAALCMLALAIPVGGYWFLPPDLYLMPIGWSLVGGLNIAIIALLQSIAKQLAAANDRQALLFQELRHRVANSMLAASGTVEAARMRIKASPADADHLLQEAVRRITALAEIHRRLNDPGLLGSALGDTLRSAVSSVIDRKDVVLALHIEELKLSFDQMSFLTMLVIEIANNAQKHVFKAGKGSIFHLSLRATGNDRAVLVAADDGPGATPSPGVAADQESLGWRIVRGLSEQLGGTLTMSPGEGTEIVIEFPLGREP